MRPVNDSSLDISPDGHRVMTRRDRHKVNSREAPGSNAIRRLIILASMLVCGCAEDLTQNLTTQNNMGAVALSMGIAGNAPTLQFRLILKPDDNNDPNPEVWFTVAGQPDFADVRDGGGSIRFRHLRAGTYRITSQIAYTSTVRDGCSPQSKLDQTVKVEAGRITYLGSYWVKTTKGSTPTSVITTWRGGAFLWWGETSGEQSFAAHVFESEVGLVDQSQRDIELLKRRYTKEPWDAVTNIAPMPDITGQALPVGKCSVKLIDKLVD